MATEHIIDCDTPEDDDPPVTKAEIAEALTTMLDQYEATPS